MSATPADNGRNTPIQSFDSPLRVVEQPPDGGTSQTGHPGPEFTIGAIRRRPLRAILPAVGAGILVRRYRERAGYSQNALAPELGVHASAVNRWESGDRPRIAPESVAALIVTLDLADEEADALLEAAGYAPSWLDDATIRQTAALLHTLPGPQRRRLRAQIAALYAANGADADEDDKGACGTARNRV